MTSKKENASKLLETRSPALIRQLIDQLKTAFLLGLMTLWLATLKSTSPEREDWRIFVILSVAVAIIWFVWWWKKAHRAPNLWIPFMLIALEAVIWFTYWISGVSKNVPFLIVTGSLLLLWAALLLLALVLIVAGWGAKLHLSKVISKGAQWGDSANWLLSLALLASSVILAWSRLWSAGYTGWWMSVLLYLGVAMLYIVAAAPIFSRNKGDS